MSDVVAIATGMLLAALLGFCTVSLLGLARAWGHFRRSQDELTATPPDLEQADRQEVAELWDPLAHPLYDLDRSLDVMVPLRQGFVVYGFPKTGNSTLAATIGSLDICEFVYGGHHFSEEGVLRLHQAVGNIADPGLRARQLAYYYASAKFSRIFQSHVSLRVELRCHGGDLPRPFVVSAVRDPVAILLSGTFFVYSCLKGDATPPDTRVLRELALGGTGGQAGFYRDLWFKTISGRIDDGTPWHGEMDRWFDQELGSVFGVDAFAQPFPHERGWLSLEADAAHCLILRQEDFDRLPAILESFFGLPEGHVEVRAENVAGERPNAAVYEELTARFRLPAKLLDEVYGSRYARHFYSAEELDAFKARWSE